MKYVYPALFQPEEGGFFISFPDIDGCFTQASTIPEGLDMAACGTWKRSTWKSLHLPPFPH